ncbi:hypothetical protein GVAV_000214 [Gurleya vavrai]
MKMFNKSESKEEKFKGHSIFGFTKRSRIFNSNEITEENTQSCMSFSASCNYESIGDELNEYLIEGSVNSISSEETKRNMKWYNDNHY